MLDMCHYTFVKPHNVQTKNKLSCKLWTLDDNMSVISSLIASTVIIESLCRMPTVGEGVHVGTGNIRKLSVLPISFCCELKPALKGVLLS